MTNNAPVARRCQESACHQGTTWPIEDVDAVTTIHVYELDDLTRTYVPIGIFRDTLKVDLPFPIELDVQGLYG